MNVSTDKLQDFVTFINELAFSNYFNYNIFKKYENRTELYYQYADKYLTWVWNATYGLEDLNMSFLKGELPAPFSAQRVLTEFGACITVNSQVAHYSSPE